MLADTKEYTMFDTQDERNAFLGWFEAHHGDLLRKQSKGDDDVMQDLKLRLLESSPDFLLPLLPEYLAHEVTRLDAKIEAVSDLLKEAKTEKQREMVYAALGKLHHERDELTGGPWVRTVLRNMQRDRFNVEANRARIIRKHGPELMDLYKSGTGPSAESVVMRKLEDEDIRQRILRLPPKLAQVASMRYAGYSYAEIADVLGISADAVWKHAERIRSPKIRAVLGHSPGRLTS